LLVDGLGTDAICVDPSYTREYDENINGRHLSFRREVHDAAADLLLFMDVLEHIEDDASLLRQYVAAAPVGSHVLISVPAFGFLWSGHDIFLGHYRRYTLPQVNALAKQANLNVVRSSYYFAGVFPVALATRLMSRLIGPHKDFSRSQLRRHHPVVNTMLWMVCKVELPLLLYNRMFGLTVFCLAKKSS